MARFIPQPMPDVPGVEHIFVNAGGLRTHVALAGPEGGPPVVLLHGWPQHWWLWRDVIPALAAEGYRVHAPDLRGLGWTEAAGGMADYDKRSLARDILALLDVLGLEKVLLAGHDWGAWTGFLLAIEAPDRVERFMPMNILPPWLDPRPFDLRRNLAALTRLWYQVVMATPGLSRLAQAGPGRGLLADGVIKGTSRPGVWAGGVLETFLDQFRDPARSRASMYIYRSFLLRELPRIQMGSYFQGRLTVPTKMLFGVDDVAIETAMVDTDHSRFADEMTVVLVPDCGHFIVDEQPEMVATELSGFFAGDRG